MMILKDNSRCSSTKDNIGEFLVLQNIANRNVCELENEYGKNLLIYPYSFNECEDEIGKQQLFSMKTTWDGKQCTKVHLETGNLVGFIGIGGQSVSIHSRFTQNAAEDFFLHYMLQKVLYINVVDLSHGINDESAFDFMLYLFPKLLNEALAQGLYKEYQRNRYNDANIRGVIDITRHIKRNMPFNGRIAYNAREFSHDNHITELVRHTIEYIGTTKCGGALLECSAETRTSVAQIIAATPNYSRQDREKVIKKGLKIIIHPFFTRYAPLQKLCLKILRHERIKYGQKDNRIYGILFDVSYLWEEYLSVILKKKGFKHPNNRKGTGRIFLAKFNKFPRYIDFYRESDRKIVDAKYKMEMEKREDINQMVTYIYRLKGKCGVLIYPTSQGHLMKTYMLRGYGDDDRTILQTYLFQIPQNVNDYKDFMQQIAVSEHLLCKQMQVSSDL